MPRPWIGRCLSIVICRALLCSFIALLHITLIRSANASEKRETVALDYRPAPDVQSCPDERVFRQTLTKQLGYDAVDVNAPNILTAKIYREGSALRAAMELRDRSQGLLWTRDIGGTKSCLDLVASMVVSIDIGLMSHSHSPPYLVIHAPPPRPFGPGSPLDDPSTEPLASMTQASTPERPIQTTSTSIESGSGSWPLFRIGAGGTVAFGSMPGPTAGPLAHFSAQWRLLSTSLEAHVEVPASIAAGAQKSVESWLVAGTVAPCGHWRVLFGCMFVSLGAITGAGQGVLVPETQSTIYATLGPRFGVELPIGQWLVIRIHGDLLVPITPITLRLNNTDVWKSPEVANIMGLTLLAPVTRPKSKGIVRP